MAPKTKFSGWVTKYGVAKLSAELRCSPSAIYKHLRGERFPATDKLLIITSILSRGELSLADVTEHFVAARSRSHR